MDKAKIKYCTKCGNELNLDRVEYCPHCGAPVEFEGIGSLRSQRNLSSNKRSNIISRLDDSVILQIDGGVITGLLVFLTLTSLIPIVSDPIAKVIAILFTASVIIPFALSAMMVLSNHISSHLVQPIIDTIQKYSNYVGNWAFWGFLYLIIVIIGLLVINALSAIFPAVLFPTPSPLVEVCEANPGAFGIEKNLCPGIVRGSIFEVCVMDAMPNVDQCSKFMTNDKVAPNKQYEQINANSE